MSGKSLCLFIFLFSISVLLLTQTSPRLGDAFPEGPTQKTILIWNNFFSDVDYGFGRGNEPFIKNGCPVYNCYIVYDKNYANVESYDAIVFHGAEYHPKSHKDVPQTRLDHQRYVFYTMESPANRISYFEEDFYNLTATYRLDSDIKLTYFHLEDLEGNEVSPNCQPNWVYPNLTLDMLKQYSHIYKTKKKPVAWFASNCNSRNGREHLVRKLQQYINVDIYGGCGPYKCSRNDEKICYDMLKRDYFFYLSFENSNCEDYVTEKAMNGFDNDVIPIIYNGANMNNFLPPGSYINATEFSVEDLADLLKKLMEDETEYLKYFWWKAHYRVRKEHFSVAAFCKLCEILHNESFPRKSYKDLRKWWHGTDENPVCAHGTV